MSYVTMPEGCFYSLNEQVLCDGEGSCDTHVVWLERRTATELTPHMEEEHL